MEVLLLGTGAADGWPNAWCRCASCRWARSTGTLRGTTSALVDGRLLLDCGPDAPRQADRAGVGLAEVRTLLLTHAHPDHLAPAALLARSWARPDGRLRVFGPGSAIDACRHWVGPHDDVSLEPLSAGDVVEVDGFLVRALPASHDAGTTTDPADDLARDAVLYDLTAPDGSRLLYATDTGPLPESTVAAVSGAAYDVALVEETFGRRSDHGTGHLDLITFPRELARLRQVGAIGDATQVVAIHLGHHNPPGDELDRVFASWGARAGYDGEVIRTGSPAPPGPVSPQRTLVLGGARSGKSTEAERMLASEPRVHYVATSTGSADREWAARVSLHRARRPQHWTTSESLDVAGLLRAAEPDVAVLVDCLSLWLAGQLDRMRVWESEPGTPAYAESLALVHTEVDALVAAVRASSAQVVLVSNEVGSGVVPEHASGRLYRDLLGILNSRVAAECDAVHLVVAGRVVAL